MATKFPTQLDTFINPAPSDRMCDVPHDQQHADANDAIVALEEKIGIDGLGAAQGSIEHRLRDLEAPPAPIVSNEQLVFGVDGGGGVIATGLKKALRVPFDCTITGWTILSDDRDNTPGSVVIDILKTTLSEYPSATSITASAKPTLSYGLHAASTTLTGWSVSLSEGDILRSSVESTTDMKAMSLYLHVVRQL